MIFEFEAELVRWINSLVGLNPVLDELVMKAHELFTVKMLPLVSLLWYLWFKGAERRRSVFNGIIGGLCALLASRLIQNLLPHRPRPAISGDMDFDLPLGAVTLEWSSFPSDHAAITFALAAGIFSASRPLGWLAFVWATVVACLPRLYGGYHYPSDLVAGAVIGIACVKLISARTGPTDRLFGAALRLEERNPAIFYMLAFMLTYQITSFLHDIRKIAAGLAEIVS